MNEAMTAVQSWGAFCRNAIVCLPWDTSAVFLGRQLRRKYECITSVFSSRSKVARKFRRDAGGLRGVSISGLFTLFIFFFLLGAESSWNSDMMDTASITFHPPSLKSLFIKNHKFSAAQLQLHNFHSIPTRFIQVLPMDHQFALLEVLSEPSSRRILDVPNRKAVFARIFDCDLQQCLRALASCMAYARKTGRISVIFVESEERQALTNVLALRKGGFLTNDAIVLALDAEQRSTAFDRIGTASDWAEFSVIEAVLPSSLVTNYSSISTGGAQKIASAPSQYSNSNGFQRTANVEQESTIGNTKAPATLDNLAALDTHVFLSLSEVVWSKYAPRTTQEQILSQELKTVPNYPQYVIYNAALIGRHKETKSIEKADHMLRHTFNIPNMLLQSMEPFTRRLLLLKLMSKRRKGLKNPRVFFVHAQYGLGNRLRALGSAMAFARRTNRILVLIWVPDRHLNCKYTDLFVPNDEFVVADRFAAGEIWPYEKNHENDDRMKSVKWYNFMRINGIQANSADKRVVDDKLHHIYVSTCYVIQSPVTPFIIRTQSSFWQVLRTLTPHIDVVRLTERFASYPMSSMIGIHIRGRSIKTDIQGIGAADYSAESSRRTDYWRSLAQVDTFINEMNKQPAEQLFYVAADQTDVLMRLEREFPSRVFFTPRRCDSRGKDCLPFALADILLLAKCASLRGSYWSSFSELSVRIGGARYLLAGVDFGRPDS